MTETRISELEARVQKVEAESRSREERLAFLESSANSKRSRGLRVRIVLLALLIGAFVFLRFRQQWGL